MRSKKQVNNNTYERQNIEVISPRGKTERKKAEKNILQTGTASMMCIDFVYKRVGTS